MDGYPLPTAVSYTPQTISVPWVRLWKTAGEGLHQTGRPLHAELSLNQRPNKVLFFGQKVQPGLTVCSDMHVRRTNKTVLDLNSLIADDHCPFTLFFTRKGKMVSGTEPFGLVAPQSQNPRNSINISACPVKCEAYFSGVVLLNRHSQI